jgi:hypothetical protein
MWNLGLLRAARPNCPNLAEVARLRRDQQFAPTRLNSRKQLSQRTEAAIARVFWVVYLDAASMMLFWCRRCCEDLRRRAPR